METLSVAKNQQTTNPDDSEKDDFLFWLLHYEYILNTKQLAIQIFREEILKDKAHEKVMSTLNDDEKKLYQEKVNILTKDGIDFSKLEKTVYISAIDNQWMDYITKMDELQTKNRTINMETINKFKETVDKEYNIMLQEIQNKAAQYLFKIEIKKNQGEK